MSTGADILHHGGIVAGPYGTPGYTHGKGVSPGPLRSAEGRKAKSLEVSAKLTAANPIKRQPITITHREDEYGSGAFWDHYTTRSTTGRATEISRHPEVTPTLEAPGMKKQGKFKGDLPGGSPSSRIGGGKGLLMITGGNYGLDSEAPRNPSHVVSGSASERHGRRVAHEKDQLKQAQQTGRPVLGICGGSWRVLESYGGSTLGVQPKTHQTKKMPYLTTKGVVAKVAKEHSLEVTPHTMLSSAFKDDAGHTPDQVNTAHWAVAEESRPGRLKGTPMLGPEHKPLLTVSARGGTSGDPPYINRTSKQHAQSVEAFETRHGAPTMGIQWHPEAYGGDFPASHIQANKRLLNWMAQAGDAYEARRDMTTHFSAAVDPRRSAPASLVGNRAFAVARKNAQKSLGRDEAGAIEAHHDAASELSRWVGTKRLQPVYLAKNKAFQIARSNAKL
ncbi:gamma-glutamyl-gamma-aminobutyrate hydrolase family protein [Dyella sp. OK004]|uniref:gamma-glutamyl-gamma-aminobutyrate hydrolase family protein n=1 Tax=Dyella sp. OK004 TaxID=1855292 RepID=UPI0015A5CEAD|nr:gamma-glutamyl-gamma-aminobutyrate hydrolase family protein [Dyella sp. OK004]